MSIRNRIPDHGYANDSCKSNPTPVTSPESHNKSMKPGFEVPYEYEDEESDGIVSRAPSVEIVGSDQKQMVPLIIESASDPDEVAFISEARVQSGVPESLVSLQPQVTRPLALASRNTMFPFENHPQAQHMHRQDTYTTLQHTHPEPDRTISAVSNEPDSFQNTAGSSQANPINLECIHPEASEGIVCDSDDEPPESLPTSQASLSALPNNPSTDPFRYYAGMLRPNGPGSTNGDWAKNDAEMDSNSENIIADSDFNTSDEEFDCPTSEGGSGSDSDANSMGTSEHHSADEFSDADDRQSDAGEDTTSKPEELHSMEKRMLLTPLTYVHGQERVLEPLNPENCFGHNENNQNQLPPISVEDSQFPIVPSSPPQLRASSMGMVDVSEDRDMRDTLWSKSIARAPSPSDAALVKPPSTRPINADKVRSYAFHLDANGDSESWASYKNKDCGKDKPADVLTPWYSPAHAAVNFDYESPPFSDTYPDVVERALPRYEDGPFSGWSSGVVNPNTLKNSCGSTQLNHSGYRAINHDTAEHHRQLVRWVWDSKSGQFIPPPGSEFAALHHVNSRKPYTENLAKPNPSKLPISDIVNNAPNERNENMRTLKRKADAMLASERLNMIIPETQAATIPSVSQESVFPDAQPREDRYRVDTTAHEIASSAVASTLAGDSAPSHVEPARKRAKTSRNGAKPIKAFVTGVFVGCIGLASACAAFIATMPESLQSEAIGEWFG